MIRLLLADDQELIRSALAALLALQDDFEVVASVGRGDEVVAAARAHQPDIALLLTGSREDGTTVGDARALIAALRAPATGDLLTVARGSHTMDVWVAMLPDSFRWISRHLR